MTEIFKTDYELMPNNWKRIIAVYSYDVHRVGWLGVWDALKSAITRNDRVTVNKPFTVSLFVKPNDKEIHTFGGGLSYNLGVGND